MKFYKYIILFIIILLILIAIYNKITILEQEINILKSVNENQTITKCKNGSYEITNNKDLFVCGEVIKYINNKLYYINITNENK